jgi:hypothetical protein
MPRVCVSVFVKRSVEFNILFASTFYLLIIVFNKLPFCEAIEGNTAIKQFIETVTAAVTTCEPADCVWLQLQLDIVKSSLNVKEHMAKYENLGTDTESRIKRDVKFTIFDMIAKHIQVLRKLVKKSLCEGDDDDATSKAGMSTAFMEPIYQHLLAPVGFVDALALICVRFTHRCERVVSEAEEVTLGYDVLGGDTCWQKDLTNTTPIQIVLDKAALTIVSLKGAQLKQTVVSLREAPWFTNIFWILGQI